MKIHLIKNFYTHSWSTVITEAFVITRPSDKTFNSETSIDNIFIKLDKIAYRTFTLLRIPLADHFPLFMSINKNY